MSESALIIVHPDSSVIAEDGGPFQHLGHEVLVYRDPVDSVDALNCPNTIGLVFAAQLDSELPFQICQIASQGKKTPTYPVFFWGPGGSPPQLESIFQAGATDCFHDHTGAEEIAVRISRHLVQKSQQKQTQDCEDLTAAFNKRVRGLAHDLKNPLCVLHGYAQMAQMGQPIGPEEATDMLSSSREITEIIDSSLTKVELESLAGTTDTSSV